MILSYAFLYHPQLTQFPHPILDQVALVVRSLHASAGNVRDTGSIPGSGRSPGGGNGNLLQYYCLGNLMDRGAWQSTLHEGAKS